MKSKAVSELIFVSLLMRDNIEIPVPDCGNALSTFPSFCSRGIERLVEPRNG